jgi:YggT family protein
MSVEHREKVVVVDEPGYEIKQRVSETGPSMNRVVLGRINAFIWFLSGLVMILIGIRVFLKATGANAANGFANFIYNLTSYFVYPFHTLFGNPQGEGAVLEITSLVAIGVYFLITLALVALINILFTDSGGTRIRRTIERT